MENKENDLPDCFSLQVRDDEAHTVVTTERRTKQSGLSFPLLSCQWNGFRQQ
jgi:hypothetical protein